MRLLSLSVLLPGSTPDTPIQIVVRAHRQPQVIAQTGHGVQRSCCVLPAAGGPSTTPALLECSPPGWHTQRMDLLLPADGFPSRAGWRAELQLGLAPRAGLTTLVHNRHDGPLRVQKLLHPAPGAPAQVLLVHPPGGIAGDDQLHLDIDLQPGAQALITTPGATRWYRNGGRTAHQQVDLRVASGATLEWLPQDTLVQNDAWADSRLHIDLQPGATLLGWELLQLGQPLVERPWRSGEWQQRFELRRGGRLLLAERARFQPMDLQAPAPQVLAGRSVLGTLWATGPGLVAETEVEPVLAACRAQIERASQVCAGLSWLEPSTACLCIRALAHDAAAVRAVFLALWRVLRPVLIGQPAVLPRIWRT